MHYTAAPQDAKEKVEPGRDRNQVQTLTPERTVETLDKGVVRGLIRQPQVIINFYSSSYFIHTVAINYCMGIIEYLYHLIIIAIIR